VLSPLTIWVHALCGKRQGLVCAIQSISSCVLHVYLSKLMYPGLSCSAFRSCINLVTEQNHPISFLARKRAIYARVITNDLDASLRPSTTSISTESLAGIVRVILGPETERDDTHLTVVHLQVHTAL
jgi:hypothetical protein